MDIKIGEYVRTRNGKIDKVINPDFYMGIYMECKRGLVTKNEIAKHDFDIKELIEKNDIVEYSLNAMMVPGIAKVSEYREARTNKKYLGVLGYKLDRIKILRILTEEQFKNVSYEV